MNRKLKYHINEKLNNLPWENVNQSMELENKESNESKPPYRKKQSITKYATNFNASIKQTTN